MKVHPITGRELWAAQCALLVAIVLQILVWAINRDLTYGPHGVIVAIEAVLALVIGTSSRNRHVKPRASFRFFSILLLGMISAANIISFFLVARLLLVTNSIGLSGRELLIAAMAIFLTNIIVFALWYWEIDSPGLTGTKWSKHDRDFQFTQQNSTEFASWQPTFVDYLYLSITNGINFAPADAQPLSHQAKLLMATQALVSVFTLALVLARSISILG
jgi:hypothetical protein